MRASLRCTSSRQTPRPLLKRASPATSAGLATANPSTKESSWTTSRPAYAGISISDFTCGVNAYSAPAQLGGTEKQAQSMPT